MFSRAISIVSAAIAIATGLVVLVGYFLSGPGGFAELANLRQIFLEWAVVLASVTLLVGLINLLLVHLEKLRAGGRNVFYSGVLITSLVLTFLAGVLLGPDDPLPRWIFDHIQVPVETSLMALLAVSLAYAGARLLWRRIDALSILFVGAALLALLGMQSFPFGDLPLIGDLIGSLNLWLAKMPAAAGARGILLGVALGTVATGLRILMGADRPYGG